MIIQTNLDKLGNYFHYFRFQSKTIAQNGLKINPSAFGIQTLCHKHTFSEPYGYKEQNWCIVEFFLPTVALMVTRQVMVNSN